MKPLLGHKQTPAEEKLATRIIEARRESNYFRREARDMREDGDPAMAEEYDSERKQWDQEEEALIEQYESEFARQFDFQEWVDG